MPEFRADIACLVGAWCAAALWGVFGCFISFALSQVYGLHRRGEVTRSIAITTIAALVLYGLSTAHVAISLRRLVIGFIYLQGPGTLPYFANVTTTLNRAKDLIYVTSMIISDSIVVWRCWAIWNGNIYVMTLPILLVIATAVSAYAAVAQYFLQNPDIAQAVRFGRALFAVSFTTNVFVTLLSAGRLWWVSRKVDQDLDALSGRTIYRRVTALVVETGAIIAVAKIFEFCLFEVTPTDSTMGFNAFFIVIDMMPHINGIIPTAIVIIVLLRREAESPYKPPLRRYGDCRHSVVASKMVFAHTKSQTQTTGTFLTTGGTELYHGPDETDTTLQMTKQPSYAQDEEAMLEGCSR
ncbi:hypothetical protein K488DRAFT_88389 [Vararia minispora EC-137]|uniref:Uncharacterized protein n=1 Tax=Vararia minispora EC-137 TaxID=1314806 RepID=A0ACB8QD92_9AGAM|nr:hypothetical protein K488DRAFT_88389 [Vararia minispora EC-137]